ncbi:hypothetical protein V491_08756 [Pseudogymnoascus sp. VKM F-3775]|nr:hypothetical protein V491_08756 [Pseudogymnoascus sp. VKM F-3775]
MSTHPTQTPISTTTVPTQTTTTTTATTHHTPNNSGLAQKAHSALAAAHGTGEAIRGHFNSAVDDAFGDVCAPPQAFPFWTPSPKGVQKNARVENEGLNEIASGHFGTGTKVREGAVPGDGGKRSNEMM